MIPSMRAAEALPARRQQLQGQPRVLRRRHALGQRLSTTRLGNWKTILVGGLNNGGKGYYALDVTDPLAPKGLWEFKWSSAVCPWSAGNTPSARPRQHLGLPPRPDLRPAADHQARRRHLGGDGDLGLQQRERARPGRRRRRLPLRAQRRHRADHPQDRRPASATRPRRAAWRRSTTSSTWPRSTTLTLRVYGTDVLGNIWRFDVNDNIAPAGREATLLGTAKDSGGTPQPITIRPELTQLKDGKPMVFVGTGKLLGATDVADLQVQSVYGIVDPMTGSPVLRQPARGPGAAGADPGRQRRRHLPHRRLHRHGGAVRGRPTAGSSTSRSGRAGQRRDEAALGHPGRRQQRAADQRLRQPAATAG